MNCDSRLRRHAANFKLTEEDLMETATEEMISVALASEVQEVKYLRQLACLFCVTRVERKGADGKTVLVNKEVPRVYRFKQLKMDQCIFAYEDGLTKSVYGLRTQVRTTRGTSKEVRVSLVFGELIAGYEL